MFWAFDGVLTTRQALTRARMYAPFYLAFPGTGLTTPQMSEETHNAAMAGPLGIIMAIGALLLSSPPYC